MNRIPYNVYTFIVVNIDLRETKKPLREEGFVVSWLIFVAYARTPQTPSSRRAMSAKRCACDVELRDMRR